jgi:two-component system, chemotaxis family, chemotaxis protein CheY
LLQEIPKRYGAPHVAVNGKEAVEAVRITLDEGEPYDLVCLDIMMPEMDGHQALKEIRAMEESRSVPASDGAKVFMTSALDRVKDVSRAFHRFCGAYLVKPIEKAKLLEQLQAFQLV